MGADYSTHCPECGEHALRVWEAVYFSSDISRPTATVLKVAWRCECRECNFTFRLNDGDSAPLATITLRTHASYE